MECDVSRRRFKQVQKMAHEMVGPCCVVWCGVRVGVIDTLGGQFRSVFCSNSTLCSVDT